MPSYSVRQVPADCRERYPSFLRPRGTPNSNTGCATRDHTVHDPTGIRLYGEAFRLFLNTAGDD